MLRVLTLAGWWNVFIPSRGRCIPVEASLVYRGTPGLRETLLGKVKATNQTKNTGKPKPNQTTKIKKNQAWLPLGWRLQYRGPCCCRQHTELSPVHPTVKDMHGWRGRVAPVHREVWRRWSLWPEGSLRKATIQACRKQPQVMCMRLNTAHKTLAHQLQSQEPLGHKTRLNGSSKQIIAVVKKTNRTTIHPNTSCAEVFLGGRWLTNFHLLT